MSKTGLIVAKRSLVRDGLQAVLSAISGMEALEPADDEIAGLDRLRSLPDLVILDSSLAQDALHTILETIKAHYPDVRSIVVVSDPQQRSVIEATGADAALVEGCPAELLSATIKTLLGLE